MDPSRNPAHLHNLVHMDDQDDDEPEIDDDADMEDDDSASHQFAVAPVAGSHASSHAAASDDFDDDMDDESSNDRQRLSDASVLLNLRGAPASSDHMDDYDDGDDDDDEDEDDHEGDDDDDGDHDDVDEELAALAASVPSHAPSSASSTPKTPRSRKRKSTGGESSSKRARKESTRKRASRPTSKYLSRHCEPGDRRCQWDNCGKTLPSLEALVDHLNEEHLARVTPFWCHWADCARKGEAQSSRSALVTHVRTHTGEKPFKCTFTGCSMRFSRQDNMSKHIKAHEQGKITLDESGMPEKPKPTPKPRQRSSTGSRVKKEPLVVAADAVGPAATPGAASAATPSRHTKATPSHPAQPAPPQPQQPQPQPLVTSAEVLAAATAKAVAQLHADPFYQEYRKQLDRFRHILSENEMLEEELKASKLKIKRLQRQKDILLDDFIRERAQAAAV